MGKFCDGVEREYMVVESVIMEEILNKYSLQDSFIYSLPEEVETYKLNRLRSICNAPIDKCGIYLFYEFESNRLLYIGCSGHIKKDGKESVRKSGCGGIKGRIVNGHQFGKDERWKSLPIKMKENGIDKIRIEWYVTWENPIFHSPIYVESCLLQTYLDKHKKLPDWNLKF